MGSFTCDFWACLRRLYSPHFFCFCLFALLLFLLSPLFLAHFISYFVFRICNARIVLQNIFHRFFIETTKKKKIYSNFLAFFSFLGFLACNASETQTKTKTQTENCNSSRHSAVNESEPKKHTQNKKKKHRIEVQQMKKLTRKTTHRSESCNDDDDDESNENPTACAGSLKWTETNRTAPQRNNGQPQSWPKRQCTVGQRLEKSEASRS